ncbi:hypothetical protein Fot_12421 [Forsythia ovata]|uniref:Uncharacterized protein n=1 Tax=Forsythia ovata TaxID=205694 RepID=A0ABD1WMG9_9LAMI
MEVLPLQVLPNYTNEILSNHMKEVLPNLYREKVSSSGKSYHFRSYKITRRRSYIQRVLSNLYRKEVPLSGRSYPTPKSEVLPNLHKEGHYRPRDHTSIYQLLPRCLRSYPTST